MVTLRTILQTAPGNWFVRLVLIENLISEQRLEEARSILSEAVELPVHRQFLLHAAKAHSLISTKEGVRVYQYLIDHYPRYVPGYVELANLYRQMGRTRAANHCYHQARLIDPDLPPRVEHAAHPGRALALEQVVVRQRTEIDQLRKKQAANESVTSLTVAVVVLVSLCLLLLLIPTPFPPPSRLSIVANIVDEDLSDKALPPTLKKDRPQDRPKQSPRALAMNLVTVANSAPVNVVSFETDSMSLGNSPTGLEFGTSMNFGGGGGASTVSFFGTKSKGRRFLFILDASPSMTDSQIKLRDKELKKTLNTMENAGYHVIMFGGGAHFVDKGWETDPVAGPFSFKSPDGEYGFVPDLTGYTLINPATFKPPGWLKGSEKQVLATLREVRRAERLPSTDWDNALRFGHLMDPPPDIIYFMSDGQDSMLDIESIIENSKKKGSPKINCLAMQTGFGATEFAKISKLSGGTFIIIDRRGYPIEGTDYILDPVKYNRRF